MGSVTDRRLQVCALVLVSLLIIVSTTFSSVNSQVYTLDLTDCSVRTDKQSYRVGEDITIRVEIGKRIPDEIVSSYFLLVRGPDNASSETDLGFLPRGVYNKTIIAEPPTGQVWIQLRIKPKPNVDVTGQIGNPTYSFEVTDGNVSESTVGMVLLAIVAVVVIAIVISMLYARGRKPTKERKRTK